jgi:hypothetical protein
MATQYMATTTTTNTWMNANYNHSKSTASKPMQISVVEQI